MTTSFPRTRRSGSSPSRAPSIPSLRSGSRTVASSSSTARPRRTSTCSTSSSRATGSTRRRPRGDGARRRGSSPGCSSTRPCLAAEVTRLVAGMTPAKTRRALALLTPVEILHGDAEDAGAQETPSIQAHVTNRRRPSAAHRRRRAPAPSRSDSASSRRPCRCSRDAPANALALLVGSQVGAAGALTQCSVEEAHRARARHARPDHVRRDGLRLRHRAGVRRR